MVEFKKKNKDKVIIKYERVKKLQNLTLYFTSVAVLLILTLISFIRLGVKDQNYYINAANLFIVIILILLPLKRLFAPIKENYSNRYIWISIIVGMGLISDYINNTVPYEEAVRYLGSVLSVFTIINILSVDRKLLSDSKKVIYSNIPHRR